MAVAGKQVGGRAVSYLSVRRSRPPAFYEIGHGTTKRYVDFHRSLSGELMKPRSGEEEAVECLLAFLGRIDVSATSADWGRASASLDHIGAKLADATLQRGVNYENMVRRRVADVADRFPEANTTSGLLRVLKKRGAPAVLQMQAGAKPSTFLALAKVLDERSVETVADLRSFLSDRWHANSLRRVKGVGPKTVSFLKLLVGLDAVAVDMHILAALQEAGVPPCDPSEAEALIGLVANRLGKRMTDIDALIWQYQAGLRRRTT